MDQGTKKFLWLIAAIAMVMWMLGKNEGQAFIGAFLGVFGMFGFCYIIYLCMGGKSGPFFGSLRDDDD